MSVKAASPTLLDEEHVVFHFDPKGGFPKLGARRARQQIGRPPRSPAKSCAGWGPFSMRALPSEHKESGLVAHDCDVPLARRSVLQPKHFTGMKLPRLAVGRGDREDTPQDREKLHRKSGMIETLLQILSAPMLVESCEERACSSGVASDIDCRSRRRKVHLA